MWRGGVERALLPALFSGKNQRAAVPASHFVEGRGFRAYGCISIGFTPKSIVPLIAWTAPVKSMYCKYPLGGV